jgi:hypothetical protein
MHPLSNYIIAVLAVWSVILCAAWFLNHGIHFKGAASICAMFLFGMLAMYIAMHIYADPFPGKWF